MTPDEARALLGLGPDADLAEAVRQHRRLQRRHHPDVVGRDDPGATARSAEINRALAVLRDAATAPPSPEPPEGAGHRRPRPADPRSRHAVDHGPVELAVDGDSLLVAAPADETWLRLLEAGSTLGGIGHVDPRLGLLELIVRFEGGPSCSVLLTLQGRSHGTEVFCEMESIEAAPTPPIGPVVDALAAAIGGSAAHPRVRPPH